jgi:RNA polymerase sigma-70 factor (ECF subfamily)
MNDAELIRQARRGDTAAFLLFYERYRKGIFNFALRLLGSKCAAEDVVHDCFASLIGNFRRFDPRRAALKTYLYATARNIARRHLRDPDNDTVDEFPADLAIPAGPFERLLDSELSAAVRGAIGRLPPLQREAVVLYEYEDLPLAEIAVIVGADQGTVKARLHRARANLRIMLSPYLRGLPGPELVEK